MISKVDRVTKTRCEDEHGRLLNFTSPSRPERCLAGSSTPPLSFLGAGKLAARRPIDSYSVTGKSIGVFARNHTMCEIVSPFFSHTRERAQTDRRHKETIDISFGWGENDVPALAASVDGALWSVSWHSWCWRRRASLVPRRPSGKVMVIAYQILNELYLVEQ